MSDLRDDLTNLLHAMKSPNGMQPSIDLQTCRHAADLLATRVEQLVSEHTKAFSGVPPEAIPIMAANERLRSELAAANERTEALREALVRGTDFVAGWMSEAHEAGESERPYILNANLWLKAASAILKDGQP